MTTRTYEVLRFTHPDGSAKEWAYAEMGTGAGLYEVRWGKEGHLVQSQVGLSRAAVLKREAEKLSKGYQCVRRRLLNSDGEVRALPHAQCQPRPVLQPKPKQSAVDIAALLGGDEDGFYF